VRVLITGAAGFAGRHLAAGCASDGTPVTGVGRGEQDPGPALDEYIAVDLLEADGTREAFRRARPDAVFHLAAEASVARSWKHPAETLRVNVEMALNVLEAVRAECPEAPVLVAGSGEVYGPPAELPVTEWAPLRPQNPYAVSKAAVDLLARFYADAHGLRVLCTRSFNHAGPGQSDAYVVSAFARQIAAAEAAGDRAVTLRTGSVEPRRDFTDVRDVVQAYRLLVERAEPETYNVCRGESTAVADILAGLAEHTELQVDQVTDPQLVRDHEVMEIRGSNERLTSATGWRPEIPLSQTLADTLDWWRAEVRW
jgi:GDP-4-dehydro-6-deoxy-D-mannose reductase